MNARDVRGILRSAEPKPLISITRDLRAISSNASFVELRSLESLIRLTGPCSYSRRPYQGHSTGDWPESTPRKAISSSTTPVHHHYRGPCRSVFEKVTTVAELKAARDRKISCPCVVGEPRSIDDPSLIDGQSLTAFRQSVPFPPRCEYQPRCADLYQSVAQGRSVSPCLP